MIERKNFIPVQVRLNEEDHKELFRQAEKFCRGVGINTSISAYIRALIRSKELPKEVKNKKIERECKNLTIEQGYNW